MELLYSIKWLTANERTVESFNQGLQHAVRMKIIESKNKNASLYHFIHTPSYFFDIGSDLFPTIYEIPAENVLYHDSLRYLRYDRFYDRSRLAICMQAPSVYAVHNQKTPFRSTCRINV